MKDSSKLVVAGAALAGILAVLKSKAKKVAGVKGIGDFPSWNIRHIKQYFANHYLPSHVEVDLTDKDPKGYVMVTFYDNNNISLNWFYTSLENVKKLSEICDYYDVDFAAWNGNTWIPSMHKNIRMDLSKLMLE